MDKKNFNYKYLNILGVRIDRVGMEEAIETICGLVKSKKRYYVVTPNIEFIMAAQNDAEFRKILNEADLAVPDSARLGWAWEVLEEKNPLLKVLKWPFFLLPKLLVKDFEPVTGTDLMDRLIKISAERGFRIGFLGGKSKLAERLKERYLGVYPKLQVVFAESEVQVDGEGNVKNREYGISNIDKKNNIQYSTFNIPELNILFVAFGQVKQEKWIVKNLASQPVKIMIGVGGAFDYLSGDVKRAPVWMRNLGLEWIFRLIIQPWRIKRFWALVKFVFLVLVR